jgi:hypothetical protein
MLDDPRMTNSTFIEGYSSTGELHYAPYLNDARISHAHGWATGPTSSLTQYVAGIHLESAGGKTWRIAPALGDLKVAEAGFSTNLGWFEAKTNIEDNGVTLDFEAPLDTEGQVSIPATCAGTVQMQEQEGRCEDITIEVEDADVGSVSVAGVQGGRWKVTLRCS